MIEESKENGLKNNVWFRIFKNKFILATIFFFVWMIFFDNNNWFYLSKLTEESQVKQKEKAYYLENIKNTERKLIELTSDIKALEKFGREEYLMKKTNEDVFVFLPDSVE